MVRGVQSARNRLLKRRGSGTEFSTWGFKGLASPCSNPEFEQKNMVFSGRYTMLNFFVCTCTLLTVRVHTVMTATRK